MDTRGRVSCFEQGRRRSNRPGISQAQWTARVIDTLESERARCVSSTEGVSRALGPVKALRFRDRGGSVDAGLILPVVVAPLIRGP